MTTELCVTIGRGANRLHRVTCPRPRVRYPLAMVAPATVLAAKPAQCCKPRPPEWALVPRDLADADPCMVSA